MTNEEYRLLIKAKFDEIRDKSYFDAEAAMTRTGVVDPSWIIAQANSLVFQIQQRIEQIGAYTSELYKKIEDDKKAEQRAKYEEIRRTWNSDNEQAEDGLHHQDS